MQDKINCNNINEIREERMQTQFYTGSAKSVAYVQYSSNPLEIFHLKFKFKSHDPSKYKIA